MWPIRMFDSPIRYMQVRVDSGPPRLYSALLPVAINALFVAGGAMVVQSRMALILPGVSEQSAVAVVVPLLLAVPVGLLSFAAHAGAVVAFDMLTAHSTVDTRWRLVELSALAYWPQLIWSIPTLTAVWLFFDPLPMVFRGTSVDDALTAAAQYSEQMAREPLQIIMSTTQEMAGIWLIALHAAALRVVSGLTVGGAWAAGIVFALLFIGGPAAVGAVVSRVVFG